MARFIPITPDGARSASVNTGSGVYRFRTYFTSGAEDRWLLDIAGKDGTPLMTGIALVPGAGDLLKGQGDRFGGARLLVLLIDGSEGATNAPGNTLFLLWQEPDEEELFPVLDPMDTIPSRLS